MNDIEEVNTMDWDSDDVTVPIPSEKQIQIAQTNLAKETPVAKSKGESPEPKAPTHNPYAAGSRINRLIPISVFVTITVHPEITESKIDGMLRETFAAIFATDEEAQILPRDQTSREPPLTKGSDLNKKNLRPIYATKPRFLKRLPDGGKKYEFHFLMQQGNMKFHDLRYEDPVKVAFSDFNMQWTASNIIGSDRVCIGWIFGKHPDACTMSNFKQALRSDMPKDTPGFDLRIEPESYHQGSNKLKSRLVKVFSSNDQAARVISVLDETCGDAVAPVFFVPRSLKREEYEQLIANHDEIQATAERIDLPGTNIDQKFQIGTGHSKTIREYVRDLKDDQGRPCQCDVERIQQKGRNGQRLIPQTILIIPASCPDSEWIKTHLLTEMKRLTATRNSSHHLFAISHPTPIHVASKFARRTALLPQPTANIRPQLAPVPKSSAWIAAPIIPRPQKTVSPKQKRSSSPAQVIPSPSAAGPKPTPVAQSMPPPAPINRDFQCYVNAIEEQRKQNNAALETLTSTLSASMIELSARLTENIQMLAATVTQNKEEAKREKEAAKQEKAQEKLEHQREKAQEKLERDQLRTLDLHQFNRTSGLVQTMYNHIRHTLPDAKHSLLTQTCDQTMAELNATHPVGQLIVSGHPANAFAVSDLITQDDSHTVTSTVSTSTNHDCDTQQSHSADEWNKVTGNRNSQTESGSTRSRTSSPARDNGIITSNQYDALSGKQNSNKKHKTSEATGPTESSSQE